MSAEVLPPAHVRPRNVIPGFSLSLGFTITYLGLIVLIPLCALILRASGIGWDEFWRLAADQRTLSALRLSLLTAGCAALVNVLFGVLTAWVLVRYDFPGKRIVDALIDLPFALPTAVAGIALTTLYAENGWIGSLLSHAGIKVSFTPLGIVVALIFVSLPFVVRTVQPVMEEIDRELEEVAATLGASRLQTLTQVILPSLLPATLTGFTLAFARSVGEYGSVIFIAGNIPYVSEIAPLLIVIRLEEFQYEAATAVAVLILLSSFAALLAINLLQAWGRRRLGFAA